jgi:ABC-type Zn2+ transport system substrate-binding protein/surface adhesin
MYKFNVLYVVLFVCVTSFFACKGDHNHAVDPKLSEALEIQDQGIHIGMEVDSIIIARLKQGNVDQDIAKLQKLKQSYDEWKNNMVVIPGLEHDHDHGDHDHAGHDHHDHDHGHDHSKEDVASQLSPDDQLKVQKEWKAAIIAIQDSLK